MGCAKQAYIRGVHDGMETERTLTKHYKEQAEICADVYEDLLVHQKEFQNLTIPPQDHKLITKENHK